MFFKKLLDILALLYVLHIQNNAALSMNGNSGPTGTMSAELTEIMHILQNQTIELRNLKQQTESDRSTIQLLQNRVLFLEAELKNQNTSHDEYDKNTTKRLNDAVSNLENLKVQMRYTSHSLLDVSSKTEQLNTTLLKVFNDGMLDVYSKTEQLNATLSNVFNDRMSGISEQIANITKKVAFTVGVSYQSTSWTSGTLVFPRVVYNIGGGYDPQTGVFTSPVDGHFVFFVNVQSTSSYDIFTYLVLNGTPKVTTMAWMSSTAQYQAGPNLAVLRLQKGDRVWVKNYIGAGYHTQGDAPITTFSGFLI